MSERVQANLESVVDKKLIIDWDETRSGRQDGDVSQRVTRNELSWERSDVVRSDRQARLGNDVS